LSKTQFKDRLLKIESTTPRTNGPSVIIKMWMPGGVSPRYTGGNYRIIASNAGENIE